MQHGRRTAIVALAAAGYTAIFASWLIAGLGGESGKQWFSDIFGIFPSVLASLTCIAAARRTSGGLRRAWLFIAAGAAAWALGEISWAV